MGFQDARLLMLTAQVSQEVRIDSRESIRSLLHGALAISSEASRARMHH
jgi:hypothetical protein